MRLHLALPLVLSLALTGCGFFGSGEPTRTPMSGSAVGVPAVGADGCRFRVPFSQFKAEMSEVVGDCLENERYDQTSGDSLQRTTNGLLVLRRGDNRIAFTDGQRTWIRGPEGIQARMNHERFEWEAPPPTAVPQTTGTAASGTPVSGTPAAGTSSAAPGTPGAGAPAAAASPTAATKPNATATQPPAKPTNTAAPAKASTATPATKPQAPTATAPAKTKP